MMTRFALTLLIALLPSVLVHATESVTQVTRLADRYDLRHYISRDDAQVLLARMDMADALETPEGLTLLARYVEANFSASNSLGPLAIETLSAEVDDRFVYIEQMTVAAPMQVGADALVIESRLLQDIDPEAVAFIEMSGADAPAYQRVSVGEAITVSGTATYAL